MGEEAPELPRGTNGQMPNPGLQGGAVAAVITEAAYYCLC